ncbi:MAG: hypothetical protein EOP48_05370 [Sphingobacteriales bacterium]|nr:MAG: hypothetical protein EOP48_05370 [Sphingobacteriales bacterium]
MEFEMAIPSHQKALILEIQKRKASDNQDIKNVINHQKPNNEKCQDRIVFGDPFTPTTGFPMIPWVASRRCSFLFGHPLKQA